MSAKSKLTRSVYISHFDPSDTAKPVDYSCMKLRKIQAMGPETARFSRIGTLPEKSFTSRKYLTKSLWLNNNKLTNATNVEVLVDSVIDAPEKLGWLDLSFNHITEISGSILNFKNIKILYLHGNNISDMAEVFKLRRLTLLRSLTLHGNPINECPNYRNYVITVLPQIKNLDFAPVLKSERQRAAPPEALKKLAEWAQNPRL